MFGHFYAPKIIWVIILVKRLYVIRVL